MELIRFSAAITASGERFAIIFFCKTLTAWASRCEASSESIDTERPPDAAEVGAAPSGAGKGSIATSAAIGSRGRLNRDALDEGAPCLM